MQFAEAAGFADVHSHIVPRPADLIHDLRGPRIFGLPGVPHGQQAADDRIDEIARELTSALRTQQRAANVGHDDTRAGDGGAGS